MAVNRYDQPAQAQFYNTYVPIPFQEMLQAGLAKQQAYNVGAARMDAAQAEAEDIQYIPGSLDERYVKDVVLPTFEDIADKYATGQYDLGDPNITREIYKQVRSNVDRERVRRIQQSAKGFGEFQKDLRQLGIHGKSAPYLNQFNPSTFSSEYEIFSKTPEALRDFGATAEGYFNQLKEKTYYDKETGQIRSSVSPLDVENVAASNLQEFLTSEDGKQAVRAAKYMGDQRQDHEIAYDYLVSRGSEFVRNRLGFAPSYTVPKKEEPKTTPSTAESENISMLGVPEKSRKIKKSAKKVEDYIPSLTTSYVDKEGKEVKGFKLADEWLSKQFGKFDPTANTEDDIIKKINVGEEDQATFLNLSERAAEHVGAQKFVNASSEEKLDYINDYLFDYQTKGTSFPQPEILDPGESKIINEQLFSKIDNKGALVSSKRQWYDPKNPVSKKITYEEVSEEYPPNKYSYEASHKLNPQNPIFSSGYSVDVVEKETGKVAHRYYMSGSVEEMVSNKLEYDIWNSMFANPTGIINITDPSTGLKIKGAMSSDNSVSYELYDGNTLITRDSVYNKAGLKADDLINSLSDSYSLYLSRQK